MEVLTLKVIIGIVIVVMIVIGFKNDKPFVELGCLVVVID